jgi:hypothetical protein
MSKREQPFDNTCTLQSMTVGQRIIALVRQARSGNGCLPLPLSLKLNYLLPDSILLPGVASWK